MKSLSALRPLGRVGLGGILVLAGLIQPGLSDDAKQATIRSQPSFVISTDQVEAAVTEIGGHLAPVTFYRKTEKPVLPYYISPWQDEKPAEIPAPVMVPLRGDFFCMPFGGNSAVVNGEKHPPHGEIAGSKWTSGGVKQSGKVTTLTLSIETKVRPGKVVKELSLVEGQNVVYTRHTIEGFVGKVPLGHHATLAMPEKEGAIRIATSPFKFGMTCPSLFSNPKDREYQALLPGARWNDLSHVPVWSKGLPDADLTRMPGRYGYADLVQLVNESWEKTGGPAWTTATNADEGYLWFSLKDPDVLQSTVFWIENHGRHANPWNGRNNCLGLEDVTSHFADGLGASVADNVLTRAGAQTAVEIKAGSPFVVNYIQGVVKIPRDFDVVESVQFGAGEVTFVSAAGARVKAAVKHEFLKSGKL
ncbi:MAG: hypothetical protein JSS02_17500 [Planctomycetes bacterium]|nr:hypothetical protein [Planctomycetota bacterium]